MIEDLRRLPNWLAGLVFTTVLISAIVAAATMIMVVSHWTAGPPGNCHGSSVYRILPATEIQNLTIVCTNGYSYQP